MATTGVHSRVPFNRKGPFVLLRPITMGDKALSPGDDFPATAVSSRRLRQLYDARTIAVVPSSTYVPPRPPAYVRPTLDDIRAPTTGTTKVPRYRQKVPRYRSARG